MKKKLSKVLAVVLSLAMVLGLAAIDTTSVGQAAKKLKFTKTGKKDVKSGQKRTLKISGTKAKKATWTVTGTGKQYIKLAKKKGKTNSFTVKANATGTAKVTAKLTKKNKVSVTYKLSCDTEGIAFSEKDVKVETGATATLKLVAIPSNAACPTATFDVVAVKDGVESKPEEGTVTCTAIEGGVEFASKVEGTFKITATADTFTDSAVVTVANRVPVLQSAKQTKINELELTFDFDCSTVKDTDLTITNAIGSRIYVKKITVDEKDNKKCTVATLLDMNDGKMNKVSYKGSEKTFPASDGIIAKLAITPETAPVNTLVKVECKALDATGVELATVKYGDKTQTKYEFNIDIPQGGMTDPINNGIKMDTVGAVAKATVTYRSGKFNTDGTPEELSATATITAVHEGNISACKEYTFVKTEKEYAKNSKYSALADSQKKNTKIKIDTNKDAYYTIFALADDDLGYNRIDGLLTQAGYVLKSADDTIATVNGDKIQGVSKGNTFVIVSDKEGKVVFVLAVEVQPAPVLSKVEVSKSGLFLSAGNTNLPSARIDKEAWQGQTGTITVTAYDQYNDKYSAVEYTVEADSSNRKEYLVGDKKVGGTEATGNFTVYPKYLESTQEYDEKTSPSALAQGQSAVNYYTIKVKDRIFGGTQTKRVYVQVTQPYYDSVSYIGLETESRVDTTLTKDGANAPKLNPVRLALYDSSNVFVGYDYLPVSKEAIELKKSSSKLDQVIPTNEKITSAGGLTVKGLDQGKEADLSTMADEYTFYCRQYEKSGKVGGKELANKIETGSYTINVLSVELIKDSVKQTDLLNKETTLVSRSAATSSYVTSNVTVVDTQAVPVIGQEKKTLANIAVAEVLKNAFRVEVKDAAVNYDPNVEANKRAPYYFDTVEKCLVTGAKSVAFTKIAVYVPYGNSRYVKTEVPVSYTVTQQ